VFPGLGAAASPTYPFFINATREGRRDKGRAEAEMVAKTRNTEYASRLFKKRTFLLILAQEWS
jgi:hypothetical protein